MKKLLIAAIAVLGFTTASAQYVAEKGDIQTSVEFRPFNNGNNEMFDNVGFNVSYFLTDTDALRGFIDFGSDSGKEYDVKYSNFSFQFGLGYEKHFKAYDRVDLFAGGQAWFGTETNKYDGHKQNNDKGRNGTKFGVGAFTGINFYVYKKLYVGAEIGLNYEHTQANKVEYYDEESGKWAKADPKTSWNTIGFKVRPALRLGWTF